MKKDIILAGVGGQGILTIATIIGDAATVAGLNLKQAEVHGMSQRGGSVVTYVKYGERVDSPVICRGEADVILSFEQLEAARWLPYLKKGGTLVTNIQKINPMPVITGAAQYPAQLVEKIQAAGMDIDAFDALSLAEQAGSAKAVNIVLMGRLSKYFDIPADEWLSAIEASVPPKFLELNKKAFQLGLEA